MFEEIVGQYLQIYGPGVIFLGAFFLGESVIITSAALSTQQVWSVQEVFLYGFLGTIASDSLWFLFGQKIIHNFPKKKKKPNHLMYTLQNLMGKKPFLWLIVIKFLYGTRIAMIMYLSSKKVPFYLFTVFNAIGTIIWLVIIITIGWFAGNGLINIYPQFEKFQYLAVAIIILAILFKIITTWISTRTLNKK